MCPSGDVGDSTGLGPQPELQLLWREQGQGCRTGLGEGSGAALSRRLPHPAAWGRQGAGAGAMAQPGDVEPSMSILERLLANAALRDEAGRLRSPEPRAQPPEGVSPGVWEYGMGGAGSPGWVSPRAQMRAGRSSWGGLGRRVPSLGSRGLGAWGQLGRAKGHVGSSPWLERRLWRGFESQPPLLGSVPQPPYPCEDHSTRWPFSWQSAKYCLRTVNITMGSLSDHCMPGCWLRLGSGDLV